MSTFDDLWKQGLAKARTQLLAKHSEAASLAARLRSPSLPGAVVLLADPRRPGAQTGSEFRAALAEQLAGEPPVKAAGLDAATIETILHELFVRRTNPEASGQSEGVLLTLVKHAVRSQGVAISESEAREVLQLLATGRFFDDLTGSTVAMVETVPRLPKAIVQDLPTLPQVLVTAPGEIFGDFFEILHSLPALVADLRDGRMDTPPAAMTRVLALLYGFATVAQVRKLLARLLDPSNRSVRLALLLYARSNGIQLEEKDIDVVYEKLLATDHPDLGPVLAEALEYAKGRYGGDELAAVLAAMQRLPA